VQVGTFAIGILTGFLFLLKESAKMKAVYIYGLVDPRTYEIKYIGASKDLKWRYIYHLSDVRAKLKFNRKLLPKDIWISELLSNNLKPIMVILEMCSEEDWEEKERLWISKETNLTNISQGGLGGASGEKHPFYGGGIKITIEHRKHMSISAKNKPPIKPETRIKMKESYLARVPPNKGRHWSNEIKKKISETSKGILKTETHNKKNSLAVAMMWAKRKGNFQKINELQKEYFNLFGEHNQKYIEYI